MATTAAARGLPVHDPLPFGPQDTYEFPEQIWQPQAQEEDLFLGQGDRRTIQERALKLKAESDAEDHGAHCWHPNCAYPRWMSSRCVKEEDVGDIFMKAAPSQLIIMIWQTTTSFIAALRASFWPGVIRLI